MILFIFTIVPAISKLSGCSLTTRGIDQLATTTVEGLLGYLKIEGLDILAYMFVYLHVCLFHH